MDKKNLDGKKVADLRQIAKESGIQGAETMKKAEIIEKLSSDDSPESNDMKDTAVSKRKRTRKKVMSPDLNDTKDTPTPKEKVEEKLSEVTKEDTTENQAVKN